MSYQAEYILSLIHISPAASSHDPDEVAPADEGKLVWHESRWPTSGVVPSLSSPSGMAAGFVASVHVLSVTFTVRFGPDACDGAECFDAPTAGPVAVI